MSKTVIYILFLSFSLPIASNLYAFDIAPAENRHYNQNQSIAEQVKKALAAVRKGDSAQIAGLKRLGEQVIPYLEPYLNDPNVNVRIEVVDLALKIGGTKALNLIAAALQNSKPQIQKSTAYSLYVFNSQYKKYSSSKENLPSGEYALYESYSPKNVASNSQIGNGLRSIVNSGNATDSAIFLLANFPGTETGEVLRKLSEKRTLRTGRKIPPVTKQVKLAAAIVLANADDIDAVRYLSETTGKSDIETLKFLLTNITEIKSPEVLLFLVKKLDDKTFLEKRMSSQEFVKKFKLPKGSWVDQRPPRRVCDLAVNSFVGRFNLKVSFTLHSTTYQDEQISEVRELVKVKLNV